MTRLVVIPSDLISDYEAKGTSTWLKDYYNPAGFFDEVYVLSPKEKVARKVYGLIIIPITSDKHYKRELKKIKPFCVRAYGGYWATDYANYNRVGKIPVISSVHDTNNRLMHNSLKFSDYIFTMSQVVSNVLLEQGFADSNFLSVLGNRVDTELFKPVYFDKRDFLETHKLPLKKRIILHVGRKTYEKNIENVIKCMSYLDDDFILVLIGPGDFDKYIKLVKSLNLEKKVFNIGKIENNRLPEIYSISDVMCVPSRWEGFGLVFVEAASCLTKIVTSNIAPMKEYLINDGVMNVLVDDYENPNSLKEAIIKLISKDDKNDNTRRQIIENFDINIVSQKELDFYKKIKYRNISSSLEYKKWYFNCWTRREVFPAVKRILKLPKRVWLKIR